MNAFELLGLPVRPGLSVESIDQAFRGLASTTHPDKPGGCAVKFAELVSARAILTSPARRLRHLAEVSGSREDQSRRHLPSPELAFSLSALANQITRLNAAPPPNSTISRAVRISEITRCRTEHQKLSKAFEAAMDAANHRLSTIDSRWPDHSITDLTDLISEFSYLENWQSQLESTRLTLGSLKRSALAQ